MPEGVGAYGEDDHDRLVKELVELQDYYLQALSPRFREMTDDHKLYLGHRDDHRQPHEKWRSLSWLGDPYSLTTTETDAWMEIMGSIDPPAQAEGVGTEDEWKARALERATDYFLRANKWTYTQEMIYRNLSIQGWKVIKTGWREIKYSPVVRPTKAQLVAFDEALNSYLKEGLITSPPDPLTNQAAFRDWMDSTQKVYPQMPDHPAPAPSDTIQYRGPWLFRPAEFDLRFDPYTEDWTEHNVFFQRIIKPRSWGEAQVKQGKFDERQFKAAAGVGNSEQRLSQWDREIAAKIGLTYNDGDPIYKTSDEYWEVWRPQDQKAPYGVIMNRTAFVVAGSHPFWHRQLPYNCIRNIPLERRAFGLGSYSQLRKTFKDRLTFRDLLLDGLLLSVMPVFLKSRNLGMTELQRFLQPGAILEVNDPNGLKRGWESMAGFAELMQVGDKLLNDINTSAATWDNVRGQSAQVGRVSATESQGRLTQALVRHKQKAQRIEEEMSAIIPQMLYNAYQMLTPPPQKPGDIQDPTIAAILDEIVGEDQQNPMGEFSRETFAESLNMNIKFRGATSKLNKELMAQQLQGFLSVATQIQSAAGMPVQIMTPAETRNVMRRIYEAMGQKGGSEVFTPEGDAAVQKLVEAHVAAAETAPVAAQSQLVQAQQQLQMLQQPPQPQPQAAPPPQKVPYQAAPPDVQRQMEQMAGMQPSQMDPRTPPQPQPMMEEAPIAQ